MLTGNALVFTVQWFCCEKALDFVCILMIKKYFTEVFLKVLAGGLS